MESLAIFLVPNAEMNAQGQAAPPPPGSMPRGVLKILWGTTELSTDWRVGR